MPTATSRHEYDDDDLMVVGDEVSLGAAFRQGVSLLVALTAVTVVQSLDTAALGCWLLTSRDPRRVKRCSAPSAGPQACCS
jgi:hypothetical protein